MRHLMERFKWKLCGSNGWTQTLLTEFGLKYDLPVGLTLSAAYFEISKLQT